MIRRFTLFVRDFIRFSLLEGEGVSERAGDPVPNGPDPSRDRNEGCTKEDNECEGKDAGPQLPDEWVPDIEEVRTHSLEYERRRWLVAAGEGVCVIAGDPVQVTN